MKVLVCGPRIWVDQQPILEVLKQLPEGTIIIHGAARGADNIAGYVAQELLGFRVRRYPVNHVKDGPWPQAGPVRNRRMYKAEHPSSDGTYIDLGIAFKLKTELSRGTKDMVEVLQEGRPKVEVKQYLWRRGRLIEG